MTLANARGAPDSGQSPTWARIERIASAVLYEGYILYPYRPSSVKNFQRWTFGGVYPQVYSEAQSGSDAWMMQTQCPVIGYPQTRLDIRVRFLHLLTRTVSEGGVIQRTWQEAIERSVDVPCLVLGQIVGQPHRHAFNFPAIGAGVSTLTPAWAPAQGIVETRQQHAISGAIEVRAEAAGDTAFKLTVRIVNLTPFAPGQAAERATRDEALMRTFVSTHTLLCVQAGAFVSLMNPAEGYRELAGACQNVGTWPVLAGGDGGDSQGEHDMLLSSPIILYDFPQIAPESAGELFDGTEIDEMLTLRVLTLTDAEKQEMGAWDSRARELLERTETLPPELMARLHGAVRGLKTLAPLMPEER